MSYKIAIASSDEINIDETFGSAKVFHIYEVTDERYEKVEERIAEQGSSDEQAVLPGNCNSVGCGTGKGCGGNTGTSAKVELILDCRCVVCKKIGFHFQKQLERKAISAFDVNCSVEEALEKITHYYSRIDNHESLRG